MNTDQQRPISDIWTVALGPHRCINQGLHVIVASIINTILDFLIVFVPVKMVLGIQLPLPQRLTILLLFAGGLLVCIAGSVRTYLTWVMVTSPDGDITWRLYDTRFPGAVELFLGIVGDTKKLFPSCEPISNPLLIDLRLGRSHQTILRTLLSTTPDIGETACC